MRRAIGAAVVVVLAAGCSAGSGTPEPHATPSSGTPSPVGVPSGTPPSFERDVDASLVPSERLVPTGATVSDVWYATAGGSSILVAYARPTGDPLHEEHGLVVWRRFPGSSEPWRPLLGLRDPPARGVIQIRATIGDVTGDGSPDALTFEDTGGSGVCGIWRVLDLAANAIVLRRKTCDTTIDLSSASVGLTVREAIYTPGDAHCCPSATKVSVLAYDGSSAWSTVSATVEPT